MTDRYEIHSMNRYTFAAIALACAMPTTAHAKVNLGKALEVIRAIGPEGSGNARAKEAWQAVSQVSSNQLTEVLAAMQDSQPLSCNYLRAAVDTIVQREEAAGRALPKDALVKFLKNTSMSPRSRRTAYEILQRIIPDAEQQFIPGMVNDPCLELRRDALALLLTEANQLKKDEKKNEAITVYGKVFRAARDVDQINEAYDALGELDTKVDLARHYGFITRWRIVAPFDNVENKGFNVAYGPEEGVDLNAKFTAKESQEVEWRSHVSDDPNGIVDFNAAYKDDENPNKGQGGNYKGAIGYAYTVFHSSKDQTVDLRVGCINGNKVWVNGKEIFANEVYHSGMEIDQYVAKVKLKKGENSILVKLAQNEQTEQWAQRWQFQLRICDEIGTAILSSDRPASEQTAARESTRGIIR